MIKESIAKIKTEAHKILKESENSKIIKEGIKTTIIGRPNVGKSSLLNKLIDEDKAIVTDTPGTTRDIVEGIVNIDGIILNVIDTAGIRQTEDKIEQIGVNKSMKTLDEADFVILVLNNNEEINEDDLKLLEKTKNMKRIIYINKNDLASNLDKSKLQDEIIIYGNTVTETGIDALKDKIRELFGIDELEQADLMYLSNARQIGLLNESVNLIEDIEAGLTNNVPVDIIAIDLKKIYELLGEIIGENYSDELIDELFRQFCLGK